MKIAATIVRILLGLVFFVFGMNAFFHFIPSNSNSMPQGLAGQFVTALAQSGYFYVVGGFQVAGGLLLLVNRYVPLGLTLLGPIIVNILCYHGFLDHHGAAPAGVSAILWLLLFSRYRQYFSGLFVQRAA